MAMFYVALLATVMRENALPHFSQTLMHAVQVAAQLLDGIHKFSIKSGRAHINTVPIELVTRSIIFGWSGSSSREGLHQSDISTSCSQIIFDSKGNIKTKRTSPREVVIT